ncbi:TetR/AcrR family transcriptional regulator C-terminal domain-containing protein [Nakamurella flavida]|uniref:TetR/AcrR family transcriptional regulator C-terminal domain-containing protein n=1 Tax=Nakamurella flavida TaxID=363630 RepID=A0A938YI06_9ACTN|nr:TetR/AcrR family transcriptional regulator C-terminal domain-containing protein [Nakamurella flavida]MBM9478056.1 TetR/AcrR family transcriptional regulator C-terminal domain-containing protein [Nakamurella flavida]MDP9778227.1 AcrR family transcriptional regulator [Nakamurella flavida]
MNRPTSADGAVREVRVREARVREPLDRRRILTAAIQLIDEDGLRRLTMRRLGAHLGVEAMALYHHVPGREDLLDGVVESVVDELYDDPEVYLEATDWQEYLQRLSHGLRRIALKHPKVFPLLATRPPAAPWLHPPLRSLRWTESFLTTLRACGFDDRAAVAAYRAFSSFLLGHLLLEVAGLDAQITPLDEPDETATPAGTDLSEYPVIDRLSGALAEDRSAEEFEDALEQLLDRLQLLSEDAAERDHHAGQGR